MERLFYPIGPHPAESVRSYILRGAAANRVSPTELTRKIFRDPKRMSIGCAALLAEVLRSDPINVASLDGYWRVGNCRRGEFRHNDTWLNHAEIMPRARLAVCPICLIEAPVLRFAWEFGLAAACRKHAASLIDSCPTCGRRIGASRRSIVTCICGKDFRKVQPCYALRSAHTISVLLESTGPQCKLPALGPTSQAVNNLLLADRSSALRTLRFLALLPFDESSAAIRARRGGVEINVSQSARRAQVMMEMLDAWPESFASRISAFAKCKAATSSGEASRMLRGVRDGVAWATERNDPLGVFALFQHCARSITRELRMDGALRGYVKQLELDLD
ncbi:TniQ family protein [Cupriavidus sp. TMH.W2]|uniref:TniQ family protein n=1 Tax=Cupriavidus sp. TMH.W2 TaxID=3434465 RepID=UPI003D782955